MAPPLTKKFTNPAIAALGTPVNLTDDDTGESTFIFDRDYQIVDIVAELPPAATIAARFDLAAPPKLTGVTWHIQEINPTNAGRVRKPAVGLKSGRKYQFQLKQTAGALLGAGAANIILTLI